MIGDCRRGKADGIRDEDQNQRSSFGLSFNGSWKKVAYALAYPFKIPACIHNSVMEWQPQQEVGEIVAENFIEEVISEVIRTSKLS